MDDCMIYKAKSDSWDTHSQLLSAREESASAVVAGQVSFSSAVWLRIPVNNIETYFFGKLFNSKTLYEFIIFLDVHFWWTH